MIVKDLAISNLECVLEPATLNEKKNAETERRMLVEHGTKMIENNGDVLEGVPAVTSVVVVSTEGVQAGDAIDLYIFNLEQNDKATSIAVIPSMVSAVY